MSPELTIMCQTRSPNPTRVRVTAHVELGLARQRPADQVPVRQVGRVVDLHAREPLKRRGRNVIIVPDAEDGRVGVEAREDGVADGGHGVGWLGKLKEAGERVSIYLVRRVMDGESKVQCKGSTCISWWDRTIVSIYTESRAPAKDEEGGS